MGRIEAQFEALRKEGRKAFIAYLTAGDPDLKATAKLIPALEAAGVDILEIGVPFSDPTADGPAIQAASQRALKGGATLEKILAMIASLRQKSGIPIVLFGYYNPILSYGPEKFAADAKASGVDGILVVDLPPEEAKELRQYTDPAGLAFITLIAPTTDPGRVAAILRGAAGFVYFISVTGVTGGAAPITGEVRREVKRIKTMTSLPIAVGFGISTPEQAAAIAPLADGIVVGSALVRLIAKKKGTGDITRAVASFTAKIRRAIDTPAPRGRHGVHG
ncbi:MAG: tryptophan synthase subunit alpha [Deltaproteobacteria bacterium]|nr:tryptophan synthase subunit alpha [Deltaproteobacteria bacterium]